MKTKELIKQLQECDPTGEKEVSVGNEPIFYVDCLPAYYDGCQQILIRDETESCYNVISAKVTGIGTKICIHTHSITDAIWNNHNLKIKYIGMGKEQKERYKKAFEEDREHAISCSHILELENFIEYVHKKAPKLDSVYLNKICGEFYDRNLSYNDPFPPYEPIISKDGTKTYESYVTRRGMQWDKEIKIILNNDGTISIYKNK